MVNNSWYTVTVFSFLKSHPEVARFGVIMPVQRPKEKLVLANSLAIRAIAGDTTQK